MDCACHCLGWLSEWRCLVAVLRVVDTWTALRRVLCTTRCTPDAASSIMRAVCSWHEGSWNEASNDWGWRVRLLVVSCVEVLLGASTAGWHATACGILCRNVERCGRSESGEEIVVLGRAIGLMKDVAPLRRHAAAELLTAIVRQRWDAATLSFVHDSLDLRVPRTSSEIVIFVQSLFQTVFGDDDVGVRAVMTCVAALGAADVQQPSAIERSRALTAVKPPVNAKPTAVHRYDWRDWTTCPALPSQAACEMTPFSLAMVALVLAWCEAPSPSLRRSVAAACLRELLRPSGLCLFEAMQLYRHDVYPQMFAVLLDPARGAGDGSSVSAFVHVGSAGACLLVLFPLI